MNTYVKKSDKIKGFQYLVDDTPDSFLTASNVHMCVSEQDNTRVAIIIDEYTNKVSTIATKGEYILYDKDGDTLVRPRSAFEREYIQL